MEIVQSNARTVYETLLGLMEKIILKGDFYEIKPVTGFHFDLTYTVPGRKTPINAYGVPMSSILKTLASVAVTYKQHSDLRELCESYLTKIEELHAELSEKIEKAARPITVACTKKTEK